MNPLGIAATLASILLFAFTYRWLGPQSLAKRFTGFGAFLLLSIPATLFVVYYLHVLPEREWFYTLRSWTGSEFLAVFVGCAGGAAATLLPRVGLVLPLLASVAISVGPYLKPLLLPLPDKAFQNNGHGYVCLQSTSSTCGPASVTTILRWLDLEATERDVARAAFSYGNGTEAWYLARYLRSRRLSARFDFRRGFSPEAGLPAVVGVRIGNVGHFIAVLEIRDGKVTYVDPISGEATVSLEQFQRRYRFTGFHMVIRRTGV